MGMYCCFGVKKREGWDREERILINLLKMIQLEENEDKKKEYQELIDKIIKKNKESVFDMESEN